MEEIISLNPLNWPGPEFLTLYIFLCAMLVVVSMLLRRGAAGSDLGHFGAELTPLQTAYLAGGPGRAAETLVLTLLVHGAATIGIRDREIVMQPPGRDLPSDAAGLHARNPGSLPRALFLGAARPELERTRLTLARSGLLADPAVLTRARRWTGLLLVALLIFGAAKVNAGLARGRPVGYLVILMAIAAIGGLALLSASRLRSRAGEAVLAENRRYHARAARAPMPAELPLAFALAGPAILAGTEFASFQRMVAPSNSGDTSGSGCGGGGGGDGGGGGCGGCSD